MTEAAHGAGAWREAAAAGDAFGEARADARGLDRDLAAHGARPAAARPSRAREAGAYAVLLALTALFVGSIFAAPWLLTHGHEFLARVVYVAFQPACHQRPERSFWLFGAPLAVCSRCTAIYAGTLAGFVLAPLAGRALRPAAPRLLWLVLAAAPAALDFGLGLLGVVENTFASRTVTGLLLGSAVAFYIVTALVDALVALSYAVAPRGDVHGSE